VSSIQTKPGQILDIWKSIHGPLPKSIESAFLICEEVQRLSYYSTDIIRQAMLAKANTLIEVVQQIEFLVDREEFVRNSRNWLRENFNHIEKEINLQIGSYQHAGQIYSVRKNPKTSNYQALRLDTKLKKFIKFRHSFDEKEILNTLHPSDRLSLAQAIKISNEWGICCHCGRILTARKSVGKGMGPICEQHYT